MQAVGLSAKERARLQADDVNISRSGDSVYGAQNETYIED